MPLKCSGVSAANVSHFSTGEMLSQSIASQTTTAERSEVQSRAHRNMGQTPQHCLLLTNHLRFHAMSADCGSLSIFFLPTPCMGLPLPELYLDVTHTSPPRCCAARLGYYSTMPVYFVKCIIWTSILTKRDSMDSRKTLFLEVFSMQHSPIPLMDLKSIAWVALRCTDHKAVARHFRHNRSQADLLLCRIAFNDGFLVFKPFRCLKQAVQFYECVPRRWLKLNKAFFNSRSNSKSNASGIYYFVRNKRNCVR